MADPFATNYQRFPTTHWSLVGQAGADALSNSEALNQLLTRYLPALRTHLVAKRRIDRHEADDILQGFMTSRILENDLVELADAGRGRFRSLLATALDNYAANEFRDRSVKKRAPDQAGNLAEGDVDLAAKSRDDPSQSLDIAWAKQLLSECLARMRVEGTASERGELWGLFELRMLKPIFEGGDPPAYEEIVQRFGYRSPAQASNALITAKRMFARYMRIVVPEYVRDGAEVDGEIAQLQEILAGGTGP